MLLILLFYYFRVPFLLCFAFNALETMLFCVGCTETHFLKIHKHHIEKLHGFCFFILFWALMSFYWFFLWCCLLFLCMYRRISALLKNEVTAYSSETLKRNPIFSKICSNIFKKWLLLYFYIISALISVPFFLLIVQF